MSKEVKEVKIKYRKGVSHKGVVDGEKYVEYIYDYITASIKFTKRYSNAVCQIMGISECPHKLLDWLQENMTTAGYVSNNSVTRESFISFHQKYSDTGKAYSDHAVQKAFSQLNDAGLIISITKGVYQMNPMFFWNNTEEDRIRSIKFMMEFKDGIESKITVEINQK